MKTYSPPAMLATTADDPEGKVVVAALAAVIIGIVIAWAWLARDPEEDG